MDDQHIDRAIDDVARSLSAGEPDRHFRARVFERLAQPRPDRRWPWFIVAPIATAALVVFALWIAHDHRGSERVSPQARSVESADVDTRLKPRATAPGAAVERPPEPNDRRTLPAASTPAPVEARATRESTAGGGNARRVSAVAALAPPPLDVPSIALGAIAPAESIIVPELQTIAPIAIEPIAIEPLDQPEGDRR